MELLSQHTCLTFLILILSCQAFSQHVDDTTVNPTTVENNITSSSNNNNTIVYNKTAPNTNTLSNVQNNEDVPGGGQISEQQRSGQNTSEKKGEGIVALLNDDSEITSRELSGSSDDDTTTVIPLPIVFSTSEELMIEDLSVSDGLNDTDLKPPRKNVGIVTDDDISVQTQIYILSGVFGAAILILIIVVVILTLQISRLKDEIGGELERYVPAPAARQHRQMAGYENGGFNRGVTAPGSGGFQESSSGGGRQADSSSSPYREMQERQSIEQFGMQERSVDRDDIADYSVYKGSSSNVSRGRNRRY